VATNHLKLEARFLIHWEEVCGLDLSPMPGISSIRYSHGSDAVMKKLEDNRCVSIDAMTVLSNVDVV
jgi:hypothetical protein